MLICTIEQGSACPEFCPGAARKLSSPEKSEVALAVIVIHENRGLTDAMIESTAEMMKRADTTYAYEIYTGARHAYMRNSDDPQGNKTGKEAKAKSMESVKKILSKYE